MTTLFIILAIFLFLCLILVVGSFVFVIYIITGGFQKQEHFMPDLTVPIQEAPRESIVEALRKRAGDNRFEEPITLGIDRTEPSTAEVGEMETDSGEWV